MKVILSRKGFDKTAGGGPSPILPDGSLLSFPIPEDDLDRFDKIRHGPHSYADLCEMLGLKPKMATCHVDPDIRYEVKKRRAGWRGAFGQANQALSHLRSKGVGRGDLFIFFGWFRQTRWDDDGDLRFVGPDVHVMWGYLQVENEIPLDEAGLRTLPKWTHDHPHVMARNRYGPHPDDSLFIAQPRLSWIDRPGQGVFDHHRELVLTKPGHSRSCWDLPSSIFGDAEISYHSAGSWQNGYFQSVGRGQEFVINDHPAVSRWARNLVTKHGISSK